MSDGRDRDIGAAEDVCPLCKSTRYLTPSLVLYVSPCYHRICGACIERLFSHGLASCPFCQTPLRRSNWHEQIFDDLAVEKEVRIRKTVHKYMNKEPEDFSDARSYNDYLELVEDYSTHLHHLLNDVDVQQVYSELEQFKTENKDIIQKNIIKQMNEHKSIAHHMEREELDKRQKLEEEQKTFEEEQHKRAQEREDLLNEMVKSDQPASLILAKKRATQPVSLRPSSMRAAVARVGSAEAGPSEPSLHEPLLRGAVSRERFDALEGCLEALCMADLDGRVFEDTVLGDWVAQAAVRAGGCAAALFHLKAIQGYLRGLF